MGLDAYLFTSTGSASLAAAVFVCGQQQPCRVTGRLEIALLGRSFAPLEAKRYRVASQFLPVCGNLDLSIGFS